MTESATLSMSTMTTGESSDAALGSAAAVPDDGAATGFQVHLDVFEGPFDLLLALISKHKLDITEIALSSVTDEFIGYIRALAGGWDLDQASYFLVVAATLLDLKAARLLPSGEVDDEEDLALLEARDLLFARLLQYRAYKEVADIFSGRLAEEGPPLPAPGPDGAPVRRAAARGADRHRRGRSSPRLPPGCSRRARYPRSRPLTCTSRGHRCGSKLRYCWHGCEPCAGRPSGSSSLTAPGLTK